MHSGFARIFIVTGLGLFLFLGNCTHSVRYIRDKPYKKKFTGMASYYGSEFHGEKTANGERFNMYDYTAAHRTLPFNTRVKVKNIENNKSVIVRINDRGPYIKGRIIDLSFNAAKKIGLIERGVGKVKITIIP